MKTKMANTVFVTTLDFEKKKISREIGPQRVQVLARNRKMCKQS